MKIISLTLDTNQPQQLKSFYTDVLGFPLLSEDQEQFSLQAGFSTLRFQTVADRPAGSYHLAFGIPSNKIAEAARWLHEKVALLYPSGTASPVVHHEAWQAKALYFYDPDFNIVELIAHAAAPASQAPFGLEQVIGLVEVGLPVREVAAFALDIREKLQLPRWKTADALFEAVGDETGMFVVVQEQRPWFPTQNPAVALPMQVEVEGEGISLVQQGTVHITSTQPAQES